MAQLFAALNAFFAMFTTLCMAGEKGAKSLDNLGKWGESATATFADEAEHDRAIALEERAFKRDQKRKELKALQDATATGTTVNATKLPAPKAAAA